MAAGARRGVRQFTEGAPTRRVRGGRWGSGSCWHAGRWHRTHGRPREGSARLPQPNGPVGHASRARESAKGRRAPRSTQRTSLQSAAGGQGRYQPAGRPGHWARGPAWHPAHPRSRRTRGRGRVPPTASHPETGWQAAIGGRCDGRARRAKGGVQGRPAGQRREWRASANRRQGSTHTMTGQQCQPAHGGCIRADAQEHGTRRTRSEPREGGGHCSQGCAGLIPINSPDPCGIGGGGDDGASELANDSSAVEGGAVHTASDRSVSQVPGSTGGAATDSHKGPAATSIRWGAIDQRARARENDSGGAGERERGAPVSAHSSKPARRHRHG